MQILPATEADIPAIVQLLKLSLGENLVPKSEQYWRWKHLNNPFGPSSVLLCWDKDLLVGIRAFMRWEWTLEHTVYHALRAVDTATHPQYQGKGIFKKLTMSLVEISKENGSAFIYNTPNEQSKQGYLKMGWREAGKLPITLSFQRPLHILKNVLKQKTAWKVGELDNGLNYYFNHPGLPFLLNNSFQTARMETNISVPYLKWRYRDVPVADYLVFGNEKGGELTGIVIGRIKPSRLGIELRITDCFLQDNEAENAIKMTLNNKKNDLGIDYCTFSGLGHSRSKQLTGRYRWTLPIGPIVTIRSLCLNDLGILQKFNNWSPSIGDLELF